MGGPPVPPVEQSLPAPLLPGVAWEAPSWCQCPGSSPEGAGFIVPGLSILLAGVSSLGVYDARLGGELLPVPIWFDQQYFKENVIRVPFGTCFIH